jgi:hypothetical protein
MTFATKTICGQGFWVKLKPISQNMDLLSVRILFERYTISLVGRGRASRADARVHRNLERQFGVQVQRIDKRRLKHDV